MRGVNRRLCFAFLILPFVLASCGYQQSGNAPQASSGYQWRSLYRTDIRTVAVPIFLNKDFRRGVEFRLTKAVINQIEAQTPYKVVSREKADTILEGEITSVGVNTVSEDPNLDIPQEQLMTLTINFTWKNLHTGEILVERKDFQQSTMYYPTLGEGEFAGSQEAVEKLAVGIVQQLQADW
jgi:Lipopolysaccharide-assembly